MFICYAVLTYIDQYSYIDIMFEVVKRLVILNDP